jgi:hypothetical protein
VHYLLFYEFGGDYLARRPEFRKAHLELAWATCHRGELLLGGALADPIDGALIDGAILLFRCDSPAVVEDFVRVDPYVTGGLVKHWYIRQWHTVVGENSVNPIQPVACSSGSEPLS